MKPEIVLVTVYQHGTNWTACMEFNRKVCQQLGIEMKVYYNNGWESEKDQLDSRNEYIEDNIGKIILVVDSDELLIVYNRKEFLDEIYRYIVDEGSNSGRILLQHELGSKKPKKYRVIYCSEKIKYRGEHWMLYYGDNRQIDEFVIKTGYLLHLRNRDTRLEDGRFNTKKKFVGGYV